MVQELANAVPDYLEINRSRCFLHVVNLVAKALIKQFDANAENNTEDAAESATENAAENAAENATENTAEGAGKSTAENDIEDNSEAEDDADLESEIIETMYEDKDNNAGGEDSDGEDQTDTDDPDDPDDATNPSVLGDEEQEALNVAIQPVRLVLAKVSCSAYVEY